MVDTMNECTPAAAKERESVPGRYEKYFSPKTWRQRNWSSDRGCRRGVSCRR